VAAATALPWLGLLVFAARHYLAAPYLDAWGLVEPIARASRGELTLAELWEQKNVHRIFFPKLVMIPLAVASGWNMQLEVFVIALLAGCAFAALAAQVLRSYHGLREPVPAFLLPLLSLLCFSLSQYENWLWGMQIQLLMGFAAACAGLVFLAGPPRWRLWGAIPAGFIATHSFATGLAYWPAGLFSLALLPEPRSRRLRQLAIWCLAAALSVVSFAWGYRAKRVGTGVLASPLDSAGYVLAYLGSPLAGFDARLAAAVGIAGAVACAGLAAALVRRGGVPLPILAPYLVLALYSLGCAALTANGRIGLNKGIASRYATFANPLWVSLLVLLALARARLPTQRGRAALLAALLAIFGAIAGSSVLGAVRGAQLSERVRLAGEQLVASYPEVDAEALRTLNPRRSDFARALVPTLAELRLSVFARGGAPAASVPTAGAAPRPNIVLIVVDTLRRDHLGCYGYSRDTSPHIDALARAGVRYTHATSQAPWTTPSIAAILTSRYPSALGIVDEPSPLRDDAVTLAETLSAAGYHTEAVVSHFFCSSRWNFQQGFAGFDESNVLGHNAVTSELISRRAIEIIDAAAGRPFFLWLHYFDPHFDYIEHEGHRFPGGEGYSGPVFSGMDREALGRALGQHPAPADLAQVERLYDSEIAFTDQQIGAVIEHLKRRGLFDSSLVIVTADHGEEFFDHGRLGHSRTLFGELVDAPLIIKYPDGRTGVVDEPVALLDVHPTVLDAAGIPIPASAAGRSLYRPLPREPERPIFSETSRRNRLRSVRFGSHKLVMDLDSGKVALYDRTADPDEQHDLAANSPELVASLRGMLEEWMQASAAPASAAPRVEIDAEAAKRLRALGYLEEKAK
jgi:arylsulfatase A-like enzyme